jgi:hypothetical protein
VQPALYVEQDYEISAFRNMALKTALAVRGFLSTREVSPRMTVRGLNYLFSPQAVFKKLWVITCAVDWS